MVTKAEAARRWVACEDRWLSWSCDGSSECPDLPKRILRDLMNDAAVVVDRFSEAAEGMCIVCDLFGVEDEAEVIWRESSMSVKDLNVDVNPLGGGSSGRCQPTQRTESGRRLTNGLPRIRRRRSSGNGYGWFGPDGSQGAILIPRFAPPRSTIFVAKVIPTLISIVAYSPKTLRQPVSILSDVVRSDQTVRESRREQLSLSPTLSNVWAYLVKVEIKEKGR